MFDTNTYQILLEKELQAVIHLVESGSLIVYGCSVIRDELRNIPKSTRFGGKSFRSTMLSIYDSLVKKHSMPVDKVAETPAKEYLAEYEGGMSKSKLCNDFLIVAAATLKCLDIVVSEDNKTLRSRQSLLAYNKVNHRNGLATPRLLSLEELLRP